MQCDYKQIQLAGGKLVGGVEPRGGGGVKGGGVNFLLLLASQNPYPIILVVYSVAKNRPNLRLLLGKCNFHDPSCKYQYTTDGTDHYNS